jgi:hypothetical protein
MAGFDHIGHIIGGTHRCGGVEGLVGMVWELG